MLNIPNSVKLIIADFDGIMTDNCIYIDKNLDFSRKLNFKDIMAVSRLRRAGFEIIFVSGEKNPVIDLLAEKFNMEENYQDIRKKIDVIKEIVNRKSLKQGEFVYMGDDINDKESLEFSDVKVTVPNAVKSIKSIEGIQITEAQGGSGAFREVADCLLNI
ncbi:HAD hydrolase family protein [bacterium]|nr:HAD hydrolase family protein [bacterium]